jgi:hypothetical protein
MVLKLINGEDIIGNVDIERNNVRYKITDPMYIVESRDQFGRVVTKLASVLALSDEKYIYIDQNHVLTSFTTKGIINTYYDKIKDLDTVDNLEQKVNNAIKELDENGESAEDILTELMSSGKSVH